MKYITVTNIDKICDEIICKYGYPNTSTVKEFIKSEINRVQPNNKEELDLFLTQLYNEMIRRYDTKTVFKTYISKTCRHCFVNHRARTFDTKEEAKTFVDTYNRSVTAVCTLAYYKTQLFV